MPTSKNRTNITIDEDKKWNSLAEKRDTKDAKFISHAEAWELSLQKRANL